MYFYTALGINLEIGKALSGTDHHNNLHPMLQDYNELKGCMDLKTAKKTVGMLNEMIDKGCFI